MPESRFYRERAAAERLAAETALPKVRDQHLRAAEVWEQMAEKAATTARTRESNQTVKQEQARQAQERARLKVRVRRVA
jgi:hypothetical protein